MRACTLSRLRPLGLALSLAAAYPLALAAPQGAQVVQGQVTINPGLIQQGSDKAIVNWQSFSIAAGESLRIQQPTVNSVLLNRVVGGDPSLILGQIQANGRVFLINPRGIVFGKGSQVDAGGLVASTLDLSDTQFLAGNYRFSAGKDAGGLQADGRINAPGGTVALVAPQLSVGGSITARRVGLAAASTVQVDVEGDGLVLFNLRNDDNRDVALKVSGRLQAEGSVEARAQARAGAAGQVLNMDGIVQARGISQQGGRIVIDGGTAGDTLVTGSLDASGDKGGSIDVLGQRVGLLDGARLDASGRLGGGALQIGGGFHGEGTAHNAQRTFIGANVELRADATEQGDGGRVAIWADQRTDMLGHVWARGGRLGGNGGFVETSGKQVLNMPRGGVDVSAARGLAGQWLLDPYNLTITDTAGAGGDVTGTSPFQSGNSSAVLDVGVLNNALALGNVIVQTGSGGNQAGNISVDGDIHATGATGLSLIAHNAISFTGNGKIRATGTALDVSLQAGAGGVDTTAGSIDTLGGKLNVVATGAVSLGSVSSGDLAVTTSGAVSLSTVQSGKLTVDASGGSGNVTLPSGNLSGPLSVTTGGGGIVQGATLLTVNGAAILSSGGGNIGLGKLGATGKLDITTSSGNVSLGVVSVGGQLKFASTSGTLGQTDALNVAGGVNISTGGAVTLNNASNDLGGTLDITAGTTDLLNGGNHALTLGTLNTGALKVRTGSGQITLGQGSVASLDAATTSNGNIVQGATALAVGGAALLSSGAGTVTLGNLGTTGKLDITTSSGNVSLGMVSVGGQLKFTSSSGSLGQTDALSVTGGANISTGGAVVLNNASNDLGGTLDIAAGTTDLLNGGNHALTLGTLNTGALKVRAGSGQITLGQGSVASLDAATTAGGNIVQGASPLAVGGDALLSSGNGSITLGNLSPTGKLDISTGSGQVTLGAGSIGGQLKFASSSGSLGQTSGFNVAGGVDINTSGAVTLNNAANNLGGTVSITAAATDLRNGGSAGLTLGTLNTGALKARTGSGTLTLGQGSVASLDAATTAGGSIVQGSTLLAVGGNATLSSGAGGVTLGKLSATGDLDISTGSGDVSLGAVGVGGQLRFASASGSLAQTGALNVAGGANIGTTGIVTLNNAGNDLGGSFNITAGTTDLRSAGNAGLTLGTLNTGALKVRTGSGTLTLGQGSVASLDAATTAGGNIVQGASLLAVGGDAVLSSGNGSITLGQMSPAGKLDVTTGNGNVTLGASSVGGQLLVSSTNGSLSQTGALTVNGTTDIHVGGDIRLNDPANFWNGGVQIFGRSLDLSSAGNLSLLGLTLANNQALSLQALGNLNLGASVNLDTGSADLTLASGGSFNVLGTLSGGNISLTADSGLSLGHDVTASGSLQLSTHTGGISQTGGRLSVAGTTTVSAGNSPIVLNQPANHFGNAVALMGADSTLFGNSAITLGTSSTGNLSITAAGAITQVGALTVAGTTTLNAGSAVITLGDPLNDLQGDVTVTAGSVTLTTLHDLHLFALSQQPNQALVLDAGGVLYLPNGTTNIATGTGALTLSSRSGPFTTFGTLQGGNVTLRGQSVLLNHSISAGGTLDVQSTGGTISQDQGSLTVTGASSFDAGNQAITLNGSSNDLRGAVSLRGGDALLHTLQGVSLGQAQIAGNLTVHSGGAITQTAAGLNVSGTALFDAGSAGITLNGANNNWGGAVSLIGGAANLSGGGAVALGSVSVGSLELQANGAVTQSSALSMAGALKVNAGTATIDLSNSSNVLSGTVELTGGGTQLRTQGPLSLGQVGITGNLSARSGGPINQVAGSVSVSGTANFNAGGAAITLANLSNSWGGAVSLTGGVSQLNGSGNLALGSVSVSSLDLKTSGKVSQTSALSLSGALKVDAGTGDIDLSNTGNQLGGVVTLKGGITQVQTAAGLTLGNLAVGELTVNASGPVNLGQGNVGANLVANSGNGAISQTGVLHVNGAAAFNSGSGNITLSNSGNQLLGALSLTGNVVTIFNQPSLNFGTLSFNSLDATSNGSIVLGSGALSGSLSAKALGGSITQIAGGLTVAGNATLQASTGITMTDAANHLNGVVNLSGGASSVRNAGNLRLGTLSTAGLALNVAGTLDLGGGSVGGMLNAVSSGTIGQTGALSVTGATSLNAGSAGITLGQAGNSFTGSVDLRGGSTVIHGAGALSLGSLNVGALTASSTGALRLGTGAVGGDLSATGTAITQASGGLAVSGASTLNTGSGSIDLAESNAFAGAVSLTGGDVTLVNGGALRLGSFTAHDLKVSASGDLDLGGGSLTGELTATTRGSKIGQSAPLTVRGVANFIADGSEASLVLDQAGNQLLGGITMRGVNGGSFGSANISSALDLNFSGDVKTLTLNSGGVLTLGGGHSTTLTAGANKAIVLTGALEVSGLMTLIANGGAAVPVDMTTHGAGNDFNRVELKSANGGSFGRVQLRDGDASRHDGIKVSGDAAQLDITSAGTLDLGGGSYGSLMVDTAATGAAIKQSGALVVSGLTTLKAGSGDITLDRPDNQLPAFAIDSAGIASLASLGDYSINASNVSKRLALSGAGAVSLVGPLAGTGELVMKGSGSLTMTTAQTYGGGTRIESGTVVLQGASAQAGSGPVQLGVDGQLDLRDGAVMSAELVAQGGKVLNSSGSGGLSGPVTLQAFTRFQPGAGGLSLSGSIDDGGAGFGIGLVGSGTLTLSGRNRYSGITDIASGTLRANGAGALSSASAIQLADGAVLSLGLDQTAGSLSGAGRVELGSFTLATGSDGRNTRFSGSLVGSGGLTKLGSGRFTLGGSGAHTGATRVAGGELLLASATALNEVTAVTVDSGATLTVQQSLNLGSLAGAGVVDVQAPLLGVGSNGSSTRWDGSLIGSGGLAKLGAGVFTLAGHNTLAGDLQANAGTLQLQGSGVRPLAAGATTGPVVPAATGVGVASGATLELLSDIDLGALTGAGQVQLNANTLTVGASGRSGRFDGVASGSGGLTKSGSGTLTLGGANLYTGATRVSGGVLVLDATQALAGAGALVIETPGQVQAHAKQTVASLNGNGALVLNGASLAAGADGSDSRFDGVVSGSGGLVKQGAGTLTLTAAHTNSGATVIEAGTVQLSGNGALGSGEIQNQGELRLSRGEALTLEQAISGRGRLVITQGQVTLNSAANSYSGATQVQGGSLITTAADRLSDASAVQVAAGAQLQLGGNETIASLQAAGSVKLAGNLATQAEQVYTGSLTLGNAAGQTLSGTVIDASRSNNQLGSGPLGLNGGQALVTVKEGLQLGDVTLSNGGRIEADRLALNGKMQLTGGSLALVAKAAPDDAKATLQGTAQVPVAGQPLAIAEATVLQGSAGVITLAEAAKLDVQASGGGSIVLAQDANSFKGQFSALSGASFNTAWLPNAKGSQAIQSQVRVSGQQVLVGGSGIEADLVYIRADQLATAGDARLVARMPFDEIVLGKALSAPGMVLELAPGAFGTPGSFGSVNGQPIQIQVGSTETGNRTTGPNAGYVSVLPKAGAQGSTAVVLVGPKVGSQPASGGPAYRFFHDGASQATEIPVVYNGVLPLTPAASGALSSINGDAEDARRARFQETVRTENVTVRLRSGVIAEVGPGRPSTQGSEGAKPPELCDPAAQPVLGCKPANP